MEKQVIDWLTPFLNLGGHAVVAAILWYTLTKWMPRQDQAYRDDVKASREDLKRIADSFQAELRIERGAREIQNELFRKAVVEVSKHTKDICEEVLDELHGRGKGRHTS